MKSCNLLRTLSLSLRMRMRIARSSFDALSATSVSLKKASKIFFSRVSFSKSPIAISASKGQSFTLSMVYLSRLETRKDLPTFIISGIARVAPFLALTIISPISSTANDGESEYSKSTLSASAVSFRACKASAIFSYGTSSLAFFFPPCDCAKVASRSRIFGYSSVVKLF